MAAYDLTLAKLTKNTYYDFNEYGYKGFSIGLDCDGISSICILDSKKAADPEVEEYEDLILAELPELAKRIEDVVDEEDCRDAKGYKWAIAAEIDAYLATANLASAKRLENALIKARNTANLETLVGQKELSAKVIQTVINK